MANPLRLEIDFNYGGRSGDEGAVCLSRKSGDRSKLLPHIQAQFDAAGIEPTDGLEVVIFDPACDCNDEGVICDIVVPGTMRLRDGWWTVVYPCDACEWVPSDSN